MHPQKLTVDSGHFNIITRHSSENSSIINIKGNADKDTESKIPEAYHPYQRNSMVVDSKSN